VLELVNLIKQKYITVESQLKPMDMARKASFFTMDVISDIAFSRSWGGLEKDEDVNKWFEAMEGATPTAITISTLPWLASFFSIPFIGKLIKPSAKDKTGMGRLLGVVTEIVSKRFEMENPGQDRDMMGSFIRHGVTQNEAVSEATVQMYVYLSI